MGYVDRLVNLEETIVIHFSADGYIMSACFTVILTASTPLDGTNFPVGFSSVPLITNVMCSGRESKLAECTSTYQSEGSFSCEIAGVDCILRELVCHGDHLAGRQYTYQSNTELMFISPLFLWKFQSS